MKVAELEGARLDYWVARADGYPMIVDDFLEIAPFVSGDTCVLSYNGQIDDPYSPSTDWSRGGPIIEREKITICPAHPQGWSATIDDERWKDNCVTPLIAAMRCFVASKFGEEVDDRQADHI